MQKKIIALAIASAISAPAFADNANVSIYGKAFLTVDSVSNDKATSQMRVNTNASRLGVKGSEDLGDGLKTVYQYEVEMDADGSTGAGLGKSRNSGLGLDGGFGKVILGIWDTPFKVAHNKIELFDNTTSWTSTKVIGHTANGKDYNSRQKNSVMYWSPKFGGVQIAAAYTADETTNYKNSVSASATYDDSGLYVAAAYENRPGQTTANTADTGTRLVANYSLGDFALGGMYENLVVNTSTSLNYTQNNTEVVASYKMGSSNLAVAYAKAGASSTANTGASLASLRYGYNFSKRTEVFAAYSNLKSESAAGTTYKLAHGGSDSVETVGGLGIIHSF